MAKNVGLVVSIVVCFMLAGALISNYRSQNATNDAVNKLQRQLDQQAASNAPKTQSPSPPATTNPSPLVIDPSNGLPTDYARRHSEVTQVMDAGWKLINQRNPAAAGHAADLFQAGLDKIDPTSPDLYNGLGRALLINGKAKEAIQAWRKGLNLEPKFAEMQSGIGWAYWRLNDPARAKQAWEAALQLDPKSIDAWSAMAWIDLALNQIDASKLGFQALLAHDNSYRPWIMGLSMAKARNSDPAEIKLFFGLPDLERFSNPLATDPAIEAATTSAPATPTSSAPAM